MTVRELIEELQKMPQDYDVVYQCCSDYSLLEPGEVEVQNSTDSVHRNMVIKHHNMPGHYRSYGGTYEHKGSPPPEPANVVIFPGN